MSASSTSLVEFLKDFEKKVPGNLGVAFGDLQHEPVELHGNERFPAASLIKLPVLIYLLQNVDEGKVSLDETIKLRKEDKVGGSGILLELHDETPLTLLDLAALMIVVSDNTATNLLIDKLNLSKVQAYIQQMGWKNTVLGRKMMVEPDAPPANFTTPLDMFHLLKALLQKNLLSEENTKLAIDILARQQYNEKIPLWLPKDVKVAHKTGEITGVRHDCGIVLHPEHPYILCLMTKMVSDEIQTDRVLAELSKALYQHIHA